MPLPEFRGNALHAAPLADFAGDADEIGSDVEIDRVMFSSQSLTSKPPGASAATVAIARSAIEVAGAKPHAPNTSALK